ncbi:MAG: DEAD/DEAH box helicase [bacterium]|nr:DEAD/DEAH box helicase [bacterium]
MISLHYPIEKLHLIGPSQLPALHNLGIKTMIDLIYYFPRDWQDLSQLLTISQVKINEKNNLRATLKSVNEQRTKWRRLHILHGLFEDGTGSIVATWFNQPFLRHNLKVGREYYLSGKVTVKDSMLLQNPTFELVKENTIHTAGIVPVYDLTEGVSQKQLRYWISQAIPLASKIPDLLPEKMKKELELPNLQIALRDIHFPSSIERQKIAYFRLAFEELFLFQLALLSFKSKLKGLPAPAIPLDVNVIKKFVDSLPFHLTNSQRLAIWEILKDLSRSFPMNRLLEGEVGSGKTVVAGLAMLETALGNYQSVMLAPTEILAWQHFQTLSSLFRNSDISIILWTRSHKIGDISEIADGKAKIIIGTHALLQENVKFQKIGLLVIDEQHRFGVNQRSALIRRQTQTETPQIVPHLLSMTATPIPRTLALAFYGDLDISQLRELPLGRKKIITRLVEPTKREIAYEFIRKQINAGRQMYVVTP